MDLVVIIICNANGCTQGLPRCTWISDEITPANVMSTDCNKSFEDDIEIIDICERGSKEFEMSGENVLNDNVTQRTKEMSVTDIFNEGVPYEVLWSSLLTSLADCPDFNSLVALCKEIKPCLPKLQPWVKAYFCTDNIRDNVAQKEIPADGPGLLNAVFTDGDGNCTCRSLSRGYFNTDKYHIEIRVRIVIEGVLNMRSYLSDDCLE